MKVLIGKVFSDKMKQTVIVVVDRLVTHKLYHKQLHQTTKYHAHDELGAKIGQRVKFVACKPYSKTKFYKVIEIIKD